MERVRGLFPKVYSYDSLLCAYEQARQDEGYSEAASGFSANLEENLINIQNHLMHKSYEVGFYRDPGKEWLVTLLPFCDHVVQWAIYNTLSPIFAKPPDTVNGCYLPKKQYCLKIDTSGCFFQVDHNILLNIIRKKIDDEDFMWLSEKVIGYEQSFGLPPASFTSGLFEEIYLSEIDRYVKCELRISHYLRCPREVIISSDDWVEIQQLKDDVGNFLFYNLRLNFVYVLEDKMKI